MPAMASELAVGFLYTEDDSRSRRVPAAERHSANAQPVIMKGARCGKISASVMPQWLGQSCCTALARSVTLEADA